MDDTDVVRATLTLLLELEGWRVAGAASRDEANALMRQHADSVLVAVVDVHLAAESGLELAADLRAVDGALPIVLVTGMDASSVRVPDDMILVTKPFGIAALRDALEQAAALVRARSAGRGPLLDPLSTPASSSRP